ncbi:MULTISPECIES: hypothetical protein [Pseudomonadaceae]|uniref:Uncharacterized protein n=1 Tax=Stutzerimonas tarimensis TaxID=1507735 RepID=A0ABV7T0R9_9GAMM|nr:hypothetical protein [Pseudomonas lopnurensis]MBE7374748.1 hypothetical protein [Pseudomonas lopnurensis]
MKPENLNPKAREAFAKTLIEVGVSIFKAIILLVTIAPISVIFKSAFDGESSNISFLEIAASISGGTQIILLVMLSAAFILGHLFRREGLRHLHELENQSEHNV